VDDVFSTRRIVFALTAAVAVIVAGAVAFHRYSHETWLQSFYRSIVTSALVGLDTVPRNDSSRA